MPPEKGIAWKRTFLLPERSTDRLDNKNIKKSRYLTAMLESGEKAALKEKILLSDNYH